MFPYEESARNNDYAIKFTNNYPFSLIGTKPDKLRGKLYNLRGKLYNLGSKLYDLGSKLYKLRGKLYKLKGKLDGSFFFTPCSFALIHFEMRPLDTFFILQLLFWRLLMFLLEHILRNKKGLISL